MALRHKNPLLSVESDYLITRLNNRNIEATYCKSRNKLVPDLEAAIVRAGGIASQSCVVDNANSYEETITAAEKAESMLLVISKNVMPGRLMVILVADDLGF